MLGVGWAMRMSPVSLQRRGVNMDLMARWKWLFWDFQSRINLKDGSGNAGRLLCHAPIMTSIGRIGKQLVCGMQHRKPMGVLGVFFNCNFGDPPSKAVNVRVQKVWKQLRTILYPCLDYKQKITLPLLSSFHFQFVISAPPTSILILLYQSDNKILLNEVSVQISKYSSNIWK
jgi:hypothetical protein